MYAYLSLARLNADGIIDKAHLVARVEQYLDALADGTCPLRKAFFPFLKKMKKNSFSSHGLNRTSTRWPHVSAAQIIFNFLILFFNDLFSFSRGLKNTSTSSPARVLRVRIFF
jgi:hypothetical protein